MINIRYSAVIVAVVLVSFEFKHKASLLAYNLGWSPLYIFFCAYVICCIASISGKYVENLAKVKLLRLFLSYLHALDGFFVLVIGFSLYFRNNWCLILGISLMAKFSFLYLFNRMITADTAHGK